MQKELGGALQTLGATRDGCSGKGLSQDVTFQLNPE